MSSKYGLWVREVPDTLLIMLETWNLAHKSRITYHEDSWCQGWPHPPSIQSGTITVLQVWTSRTGIHEVLIIMLESWNLAHKSRITKHDNPWCQGWPFPPSLQSGTINILQVWTSRFGKVLDKHHARELKFGTLVKNHISWQSIMSRMTPSSKSPVRNRQHPSSMDFKDERFMTHF